jgi:hypothetical protein
MASPGDMKTSQGRKANIERASLSIDRLLGRFPYAEETVVIALTKTRVPLLVIPHDKHHCQMGNASIKRSDFFAL